MSVGPGAPAEYVILDENIKAQDHDYYIIRAFEVSPDNKLLAYAEDTKGNEIYTIYVIDAETGSTVGKNLVGTLTSSLEWVGNDTLVYVTMDSILRPDKSTIDPGFSESVLSLVDRGFVYALAHVRGGGEMGRQWYENGKLFKKRNTFTDFITCAEYLLENKYSSKEKLCIDGASAGGLLIGAVVNMRPDLFKVVVARVPFVDVLTTMLDPSIPVTTSEWEVKSQNYPHMLVTAGLYDSQVIYSEPTKFVAKLREMKTDDNVLMFNCELGAGHYSKSGRFESLKNTAFMYTFILKALDMIPQVTS